MMKEGITTEQILGKLREVRLSSPLQPDNPQYKEKC